MNVLPLATKPPAAFSDRVHSPSDPAPLADAHWLATASSPIARCPSPLSTLHFPGFLRSARRHWRIPALTLALCLSAAAAYLFCASPTYLSTASMWEPEKLRMTDAAAFTADQQNYLGTQIELLRSDKLAQVAMTRAQNTNTNTNPVPAATNPSIQQSNNPTIHKPDRPPKVRLRVRHAPRTSVLTLETSSSDPAFARLYLDALMTEYLEYKQHLRQSLSGGTYLSISRQALRLEDELKTAQAALAAFQRTNNLVILEEEAKVSGAYLARLKTQLSDLRLETLLLNALARDQDTSGQWQVTSGEGLVGRSIPLPLAPSDSPLATRHSPPDTPDINPPIHQSTHPPVALSAINPPILLPPAVSAINPLIHQSTNPSIRLPLATPDQETAFKQLELLKIQRETLSVNLRPKHPKILKLDQDIDRAQKLLEVYHDQNREQLTAARRSLDLHAANLSASIKQWETNVVYANDRIAEAERLRLNLNRAQALYERVATLLHNVDLSRSLDQETLAILQPASLPERSFHRECLLSALALLLGLAAGATILFLVDLSDDRLTSLADLSAHFPQNVLGQLPDLPNRRRNPNPASPLLKRNDERHLFAESCRNLRSALLFFPNSAAEPNPAGGAVPDLPLATRPLATPPKILLITSAQPDEGKSTIAANLARALAFAGSRVLLVDADLRQGRLDHLLRLNREPGLADLLEHQASLTKVLQTDSIPNLWFISRGHNLSNPGDLLLKGELRPVLVQWRKKFDYVLIDSSPVFAADDVTALAPKADATLFVVRSRFSRAGAVREALDLLAQRRCQVLGLILNRVDASDRRHRCYEYPGYFQRRGPKG